MDFENTARYQILAYFLDTYADKIQNDEWMTYQITFKRVGKDYYIEYECLGIDTGLIHNPRTLRIGMDYEVMHVEEE